MSLRPWRESYLVFGSPFIGDEERQEVLKVIDSRWLGTGPRVQQLEEETRRYLGVPSAVAVNSCTAALHLALAELRLPPGSEVLVPAMTFCATANAVIHAGLKPVLVDCHRETMNISLGDAARRLTPRTKAMVPVHFAGRPCDMDELMAFASSHDLKVVEDCAHAIESTFRGKHCGTFGDFGCFSFYVTKNVITVEGGMVVAREAAMADRIKVKALHGMSKDAWKRFSDSGYVHYDVVEPGFKYNLTDLAAAFGIHQMARVEELLPRRAQIWDYYMAELKELPLFLPAPIPGHIRHSRHLFIGLVDDSRTKVTRDQVLNGLHELRIGAGVHYRSLTQLSYYRQAFGYKDGDCPNAEFIGNRTFSIPLSAALSDEDAADVVRALREIFDQGP